MEYFFGPLDGLHTFMLLGALLLALGFEFVNGFHDTANAVATVIYTHSLPPWVAVVWSGLCNLTGVLLSSGAVAFGVISLLPVELVMNVGSAAGFAMVFALLISAILWNLGTWYLGLPASSSHTLIGSIMGVGMMNSFINSHGFLAGVNWTKAGEVGLTLLISPLIGFVSAAVLLLLMKALVRRPELYSAPDPGKAPPWWIRGILCGTCTGVSLAHGSNDGQKGMGLVMLILVGIVPGVYALNLNTDPAPLQQLLKLSQGAGAALQTQVVATPLTQEVATRELDSFLRSGGKLTPTVLPALAQKNRELAVVLAAHQSLNELPAADRVAFRTAIYYVTETINKLNKGHHLEKAQAGPLLTYKSALEKTIKYIPLWVKVAVALALGCGTMIGWKRIVVTVGEKIGKAHLTYAQGAAAELVAMITIGLADRYGLPVSTTHVLSSGVAGTMAANRSGLQTSTLRNLLLAWVLTLPVCVFLGALFFAGGLFLVARMFGLH